MKRKQEIEVRLSEIREAVNAPKEPDNAAELRAEYVKLETEWRGLAKAEAEEAEKREAEGADEGGDGEGAEKRALVEKVEFRRYLSAAASHRDVDGAERELNEALDVRSAGGVVVPWEALLPTPDEQRDEYQHGARLEARQDALTSAPASPDVNRTNRPIIPRVFAGGVADFLGIGMPSVGVGEQVYTYLSAGVDPEMKAKDAEVDADAATFTPKTFAPVRLSARYKFRIEDLAVLAGMESALRGDLRMAMREAMDNQILNGDGDAPNVDGLLATAAKGGLADVANPAAVVNAASLITAYASQVDGKFATAQSGIRMLIGAATYAKVVSLVQGDAYVFDRFASLTRISSLVPAAAANIQQAVAVKRSAPGLYAVAPVWQGVELIRDPYTDAKSGQIAITAHALWNFGIVRTDALARVKFKLA